jgi:hypothetical protein
MRRSIDFHTPASTEPLMSSDGDELPSMSWVVAISDDYADGEPRVVLTVEEMGQAGLGLSAHLSADESRRLRRALRDALAEVGQAAE